MNKKQITFLLNPNRIQYLLNLFNLTRNNFIELIHENRKKQVFTINQLECVFDNKGYVDISVLKLIDKVFKKGLTWYISKRDLPDPKKSSIFFRKESFNSDLNFESKKVINEYEELKIEIQTLCKFINFEPKRIVKAFKVSDNPKQIAHEIREEFNRIEQQLRKDKIITQPKNARDFLKNSIRVLESLNIFIFEFIESSNKKIKASFNGFYTSPNVIVIKRLDYPRREIFTLFHELGHYLINQEEIDSISDNDIFNQNLTEKWCHSFSFYFLINSFECDFFKLDKATRDNKFHQVAITKLYKNTFLSYSAFYTRLRIDKKISQSDYEEKIEFFKSIIAQKVKEKKEQAKLEQELAKERGEQVKFFPRKPIESNLFKEIVKINYFEGNINESRLRDYLHISDKKSIDSVIY